MKTAKEMFEELGYELAIVENKNDKYKLSYEHNDNFEKDIEFYIKDKNIYIEIYLLSLGEIKAIFQQCKELGWLDE